MSEAKQLQRNKETYNQLLTQRTASGASKVEAILGRELTRKEQSQAQKLQKKARKLYPPVGAAGAEGGETLVGKTRKRSSGKENKEEEHRHQNRVRENDTGLNFAAQTEESKALMEGIADYMIPRNYIMTYFTLEELQGTDNRVLRIFMPEIHLEKPDDLIPKDQETVEKDKKFVEDYASQDVKKRWNHLDRMVDEVLSIELFDGMLEYEHVKEHMYQYKTYADQLTYMENVIVDPINKPYFDALDEERKKKLNKRIRPDSTYTLFSGAFVTTTMCMGANPNGDGSELTEEAREQFEGFAKVQTAELYDAIRSGNV